MSVLQDLIHKIEVAGGLRYVRYILGVLVAVGLIVTYNFRVSKNMAAQEAMDGAQLARNLAEGKGYTTSFIRPFSMYLISRKAQERLGLPETAKLADYSRIKAAHPDIANPPVYPVVLAGLMKALPFEFKLSKAKPFWSNKGIPWRYQPDFLIAWFNQLLFFVVIVLAFFWARRLFDITVARTSAILLFGSELLWRFSASGLSTMLLLVIFMGIVWCLTLLENELVEPRRGPWGLFGLCASIGMLVGLGGLTRYGFAWVIVPTLAFVLLFMGSRRVALSIIVLAGFMVVMAPWMIRNYNLSGAPFGTATYCVLEGPILFPEHRLGRSLSPDIQFLFRPLWMKLLINIRHILQNDLFTLGGGWVTALFLVGLLVGFRNPAIRRLRYFLLLSMGVLIVVQAMARTQLSEDLPEINSENFLVLFVPLVIIYAVSLFFMLLDQIHLPARQMRHVVVGLFGCLAWLPMIFVLLPPRSLPLAYPPYLPSAIQQTSEWLRESELMMSDVPAAVAWYGDRQCVWLTLNALPDPADPASRENFFAINDLQRSIHGLYLTQRTMDVRFQSELLRSGPLGWGNLILGILLRKGEVLPPFPLRENPLRETSLEFRQQNEFYLPDQHMFLTDWKRWRKAE